MDNFLYFIFSYIFMTMFSFRITWICKLKVRMEWMFSIFVPMHQCIYIHICKCIVFKDYENLWCRNEEAAMYKRFGFWVCIIEIESSPMDMGKFGTVSMPLIFIRFWQNVCNSCNISCLGLRRSSFQKWCHHENVAFENNKIIIAKT